MNKFIINIFVLFFLVTTLYGQEQYRSPLDIPLILSANFGELRPNHFHSGIDLKTQNIVNKPVYSIEDGFVSRISVSSSGYGLAIYVDHVTGQTSVYGHLNNFAPAIAEYVKSKQYEQERFNIDIKLDKSLFPVKKGDLIAYSGNTGSSFGPHVHFEIRNTLDQKALDPLAYYQKDIKDKQPPLIKSIAVYPIDNKGVVDNSNNPTYQNIIRSKKGEYLPLAKSINAWGTIGVGVSAIDKMDGTSNIYGVKKVNLYCDGHKIFSSDITSFLFSQTRMINSLVDYDYWYNKKIFYMRSFIEPGNQLPIFESVNNGYIDINEERNYNLKYELEDLYGNKSYYSFTIIGKKQVLPKPSACSLVMAWNQNNLYKSEMFSLAIPKGYLYNDICFVLKSSKDARYFSNVYAVHNKHIPLDSFCEMTLKLDIDTLSNKKQYGIVRLNGSKDTWVGGTYKNGLLNTRIRELGHKYAISCDTAAPVITPVAPAKWVQQGKINIKLSDNKSGIQSYRGTIDGAYVLFEHDAKSPYYTYKFDTKRLTKGKKHKLEFYATDACGNSSKYEYIFSY